VVVLDGDPRRRLPPYHLCVTIYNSVPKKGKGDREGGWPRYPNGGGGEAGGDVLDVATPSARAPVVVVARLEESRKAMGLDYWPQEGGGGCRHGTELSTPWL
jgi:hypothetical protein